jgi:hypothetical protein
MLCSGRPSTRSPTRVPDGVWNGPNGPQCTRLSAVLAAERLTPWSLGQRGARFIENPWATRPVEGLDFRIEAFRARDGRLERSAGITLQEIFGVPRDWPETPGAATDPV